MVNTGGTPVPLKKQEPPGHYKGMQTRTAPFPGRTLFWRELICSRVHHHRPPSCTPADLAPPKHKKILNRYPARITIPRPMLGCALLQWSCQPVIPVFAPIRRDLARASHVPCSARVPPPEPRWPSHPITRWRIDRKCRHKHGIALAQPRLQFALHPWPHPHPRSFLSKMTPPCAPV
jgi:hypothetical protein